MLAASAEPAETDKLKLQWQQYIDENALPSEALSGWHQGMEGLKELTRRLNELDERKGKYLTGSELKSMVFAITQSFGHTVPIEEQLYRLERDITGESLPSAILLQTDIYLNQLMNRYVLIKQLGK
ncbi:ImpA domain protein [Serratia marcescens]|nr:ImpA domain protein [Serratia marcescens]CAI0936132.1 ImpA domain protein [Serratia marcescens]SUJ10219.1 ImpA domain protein [Serratia marcescens]